MNAKSIYDKLVNVEGVPSSILTYSDKNDCIIIEVQDYDKSVFKFAQKFFNGYKSVDIDYTNENKTIVWYNEVSEYSDRETIDSITRFYYDMKVKGLVESKKSARKSIKESSKIFEPRMAWQSLLNHVCNFTNYVSKTFSNSDFLWKQLKKNPREEITIDEFIDECDEIIDMSKIKNQIKNYLKNDKEIEDALKYHGLWNFSDKFNESKKSARKLIKESSDVTDKIASEIDKSYWIDKLIDDLDKHYETMEKAWLKNLDKLSDEDILGIIDDCMGKSKTLVGKSEMLKNKMIDDLSKAYDDYIDDIDRQIRIGKSEDEIKDMIETTLENDIKMYLKLAYNNKASSNYFMVKFAEDNLI